MIGVIGNGSWATALVYNISRCEDVKWYVRSEETRNDIINSSYNPRLSTAKLNANNLELYDNIVDLIKDADDIIIAIPSAYIADQMKRITYISPKKNFIVASKGLVEGKFISTYLYDHFRISYDNIAVITGPCHAEEVAQDKRCYLTVASINYDLALQVGRLFSPEYNTITYSKDVIGAQFVAVLKNIYAIAAGIFDELGYGVNFKAVLAANAADDVNDILALNAAYSKVSYYKINNITKSAYLGDLLVTMYSEYSRNYTYGRSLVNDNIKVNGVAEGYYAARDVHNVMCIETHPIIKFVHDVIFQYDREEIPSVAAVLSRKLN